MRWSIISITRMTVGQIVSLLLLLCLCSGMQQFGSDVAVTYGSIVRIVNPITAYILHSHDVFFGRGGVMSVTGYRVDDLGSYWQLSQKYQSARKEYKDQLHCGDTITISSAIIGYFLRVEETQFGLTTELLPMVHGMNKNNIDEKINFQIQCVDRQEGEGIFYNDRVRLKHQITGKYASMDDSYPYTEANCGRGCTIAGQLELHAIDSTDELTTIFQLKTGITFDQDYVGKQETQ